jgi:hypothetical protein
MSVLTPIRRTISRHNDRIGARDSLTEKSLGFVVGGKPPVGSGVTSVRMLSDRFELMQSAVTCALLLEAHGWRSVDCQEVRSDGFDEYRVPVEWRTK